MKLIFIMFYTGETSFEVKTEADSNDVTEHPHDDKPRPHVCNKRFTTKAGLNYHRERHTGGKSYSCTQCEKRFITQNALRKHMSVHTSIYKCSECGKCCLSNHALTVHSRIHSGEKPFECIDCRMKDEARQFMIIANDNEQHNRMNNLRIRGITVERSELPQFYNRIHPQ